MGSSPDVTILVDDRIRLMSEVLAATDYPDTARARQRHHPHAYARLTRRYLTENRLTAHPAVQMLQSLLNQGAPLEAMYTLIMQCEFPGLHNAQVPAWVPRGWLQQLWDFHNQARLGQHWADNAAAWDSAEAEACKIFNGVQFSGFLAQFVGEVEPALHFVPNLSYPAEREIGIRAGDRLLAICPPPQAWGDSPPWPYDDESMRTTVYAAALTQFTRLLLFAYLRAHADHLAEASQKPLPVNDQFAAAHPSWEDQFITLFTAGAVAVYLEDHVNEAEARAYILMEKRARGLTLLPGTVSVLRRYLQERGNRYETLAEFLPIFPAQLRVARRIVTL